MQLNKVSSAQESRGNAVATLTLTDLVLEAGARLRMENKELAALFGGLSAPEFTKSFSVDYPERNKLMKQPLPMQVARAMALVLCDATGLAVSDADVEREAIADLIEGAAKALRLIRR